MEYKLLIQFPVTMDIKNNDDPFISEGKCWFENELINWKIIMSEKTGTRNWLGIDDYKSKKIILNGLGEYKFLGVAVDHANDDDFIFGMSDVKFADEKTYLIISD
jgi:hypothetical protein